MLQSRRKARALASVRWRSRAALDRRTDHSLKAQQGEHVLLGLLRGKADVALQLALDPQQPGLDRVGASQPP